MKVQRTTNGSLRNYLTLVTPQLLQSLFNYHVSHPLRIQDIFSNFVGRRVSPLQGFVASGREKIDRTVSPAAEFRAIFVYKLFPQSDNPREAHSHGAGVPE